MIDRYPVNQTWVWSNSKGRTSSPYLQRSLLGQADIAMHPLAFFEVSLTSLWFFTIIQTSTELGIRSRFFFKCYGIYVTIMDVIPKWKQPMALKTTKSEPTPAFPLGHQDCTRWLWPLATSGHVHLYSTPMMHAGYRHVYLEGSWILNMKRKPLLKCVRFQVRSPNQVLIS